MEKISKKEIYSLLKSYPKEGAELIRKALEFTKEKGTNPSLKIAIEILKRKYQIETACSAILLEAYKKGNKKQIEDSFPPLILEIIKEQEKLEKILSKSKGEKTEVKRKAIISTIENPQTIVLQMVTALSQIEKGKKEYANEVMETYVPLANRLGMDRLKKDLGEAAFKVINPEKYEEIKNFIKMSKKEREDFIRRVTKEIEKDLRGKVKGYLIKGREKQIYSIYAKTAKRNVPLEKQRDHFGVRIITESPEDCYNISELINKKDPFVVGTFKDYIKNPKQNGYQSIHFCIKKDNKIVEVQIRTKEMDEVAEEGAAAHWTYKGLKGDLKFEKKAAWLKEVRKLENKKSSPLKNLKLGLFKDKIYCYTPKGKIISLPSGSSALDFAYKVHIEVGNHSVGAIVEGKFVPLKTKLENGNTIEIITNKFQRPRRDWLKFVTIKEAKKAISKEVKKIEKIPVPRLKKLEEEKEGNLETPAIIKEFPNHRINFARCCNPLPEEEIVWVLKSNRRALIHKKNCNRINDSSEHKMKAEWKKTFLNPIKIYAQATDRSGILADIINTILRGGFKVKEANAKMIGSDSAECYFVLEAKDIIGLEKAIIRIKKVRGVRKVWLD